MNFFRINMKHVVFVCCMLSLVKALIVIVWRPLEHISAQSPKTVGERENFRASMSGYAQITLRCHSRSAVVNDKACRNASLYVSGRPTDRLFLCAHITRKGFDRFRWYINI